MRLAKVAAALAVALLTACGTRPVTNPTRRGEVQLVVGMAAPAFEVALDFGDVAVGKSAVQKIVATNTGKDPLTLKPPGYQGAATGAWFVNGPSGLLAPGQSFEFSVTFSPVAAGPDTARLLFQHDADAQAALAVLTGTGT